MVGIAYVYIEMALGLMGTFFNLYVLLSWIFEDDCMDTCCFGSFIHVFCIFVFAPIQRN